MSKNETVEERLTVPEMVRIFMQMHKRRLDLLSELEKIQERMTQLDARVLEQTDYRIDTTTGQLQQGKLGDGIREFLSQQLRPVRARDVEEWLVPRGYSARTEFGTQSLHTMLKTLPDVVRVVREGEMTHWALNPEMGGKANLEGWKIVPIKRRTTLASRFTESPPDSHYAYNRKHSYVRPGKGLHTKVKRMAAGKRG